MVATIYGWEMVWPAAIGRALSSYARAASSAGANRSRGTARQAARTRSSRIPRAANCSRTIPSRAAANCAGVGIGTRGAGAAKVSEGPANPRPHAHRLAITTRCIPPPGSPGMYPRVTPLAAPRNRPGCLDLDRSADTQAQHGGCTPLVHRDLVETGASQHDDRAALGNRAIGWGWPAY